MFPKIESPCPLKAIQFPEFGNFQCDVCQREVHDLSAMSAAQRGEFLQLCAGQEVCVSYKQRMKYSTLKKKAAVGIFVLGVSGLATAALASDDDNEADPDSYCLTVVGGGIKLPASIEDIQYVEDAAEDESETALIPVIVEE